MALSGYSLEAEQRIERLLTGLYAELNIQRPDDLFGSVLIEIRYQNGKPVGQVDVQLRYVMKRSDEKRTDEPGGRQRGEPDLSGRRRRVTR